MSPGSNYNEDLNEEVDLKSELEFLEREITTEWQRRWETESRGRERYKFIGNVQFVRNRKWFKPPKELVYIITGYGPIKSSLNRRGLTQDKNCVACEEEETVEHMVFDCQLYNGIKIENFNTDRQNISALIDDQAKYEQFSHYVKTIRN